MSRRSLSMRDLFNLFQTIPTHIDFFIINRVVDLSRTMESKQTLQKLEHVFSMHKKTRIWGNAGIKP